ncbi:MAG: amino acid permease [Saprospiraceae bacterium]
MKETTVPTNNPQPGVSPPEALPTTTAIKKFGTFGGVFTPTLLTILGVIMYLRLGWVVGNAGLLGAWLIIILSFVITTATALAMSSIVTNIRIGAGGAYAIISQSLGLEIGGSLGIPRYISQGLAVTMYIFGFREGWLMIFPDHPAFAIDIAVFIILFGIAYKSADLAIRAQFVIMGIIILSLFSIVMAAYFGSMGISTQDAVRWGEFGSIEGSLTSTDFWLVFAVFFPASTGIMAGANMSGELKDPRGSIPKGTLLAIGVSIVIYLVLAYWIARSASTEELINNYNVIIEKSWLPPLVIAGVLGATFSSALASIIGSSRILFAMGQHRVLPQGKWLAQQTSAGQPRNAMLITGVLIFVSMLLRDLNAIAPLVTMFFLITYAMLNVVVIIEQNLTLISFRPLFKVHPAVPWVGLIGSVLAMFIINPTISLISVAVVFGVYWVLSRSDLETPFEDVRSGIFSAFAEWATKHVSGLSHKLERAWKPNLLVPATDSSIIQGNFKFIRDIAFPKGSATLVGIGKGEQANTLDDKLTQNSEAFRNIGVYASHTVMKTNSFADGVNFSNQALRSAFFRPNIVFLSMLESEEILTEYPKIIQEADDLEIGICLYAPHSKAFLGQQQNINIWISNRGPNWSITEGIGNLNLSILIAYKLKQNWNCHIRLLTVVDNEEDARKAHLFMKELIDLSRMPNIEGKVLKGKFHENVMNAPQADINMFGMARELDLDVVRKMVKEADTSCLFIRDSGIENVLA